MTHPELPVNEEKNVTIRRGKHNKENPYVIISKSMLRDKKLSLRSKGFLCYLLSHKDDWVTHPRHIAEAVGVGKDMVYRILNELIELGYATRSKIKNVQGRFGHVIYEFYEERLESPQEIKKESTVSEKPDTVKPDLDSPYPEKQTLISNDPSKYISEEEPLLKVPLGEPAADAAPVVSSESDKPQKTKKKEEYPPIVLEVADKMLDIIAELEPGYCKPKNLSPFLGQVYLLVQHDRREPDEIYRVLRYGLDDYFHGPGLRYGNLAKKFRDKYLALRHKMTSVMPEPKKERKFSPGSRDDVTLRRLEEWSKNAL